MKTNVLQARRQARRSAFTLPEGLFGMAIMGTLFVTLYTGMTTGFDTIRRSRENLRSTQILLEKFETIRLYNWEQVNTPGFIPTNFVAYFEPKSREQQGTNSSSTNIAGGGTVYTGTVTISVPNVSEAYSNDLRVISVDLTWTTSNGRTAQRNLSSYIARYGLQNYVY